VRRKPGSLVPLEHAICRAAVELKHAGSEEFHGFLLAKQLKTDADARLLTAYGTLYRALARLEAMGLLTSRAEDPLKAASENRPARRLYTLTAAGEAAAREGERAAAPPRRQKPAEGLA
jgi:PadR family transcriptional regulator, regulatory protein PadR